MEEKGMFRSALGGFHKGDVLSYIDQITAAWNEERQELDGQAQADRQRADEQQQAADVARAEAAAAQQRCAQLEEQLEQLAAQRDAAEAELSATVAKLEQEAEQRSSATAEMMAAEERLQSREQELSERDRQLNKLTEQLERYEALLGQADGIERHMDGIVRPFIEQANRRTDETLEDMGAVLAALLAQLGELQDSIEQKRQSLQHSKADSDSRLAAALADWTNKARESAQQAATRDTRFFR